MLQTTAPDHIRSLTHGRVSTGLSALDEVLDGLRIGDNVVWRVDTISDYHDMVQPFVAAAREQQRSIIYLRFGHHPPLVADDQGVRVVTIDPKQGFEGFTRQVYQLISEYGRGAFYVFDCLSDLLSAWATDLMVGNLFRVVCPYLYQLDTVAYFAILPEAHSHWTVSRIRATTQVLIDVRHAGQERYVQPVKVWQRRSPTMFLPHQDRNNTLYPVINSSDATRLQAALLRRDQESACKLDSWDRLFLEAAELVHNPNHPPGSERYQGLLEHLLRVLISRDPRMLDLARRYLSLEDLVAIHARMIGTGYIGGKAVGMLLARHILLRSDPRHWGLRSDPHDSFFLGSDVYYSFLVHNGWWPNIMRQRTADGYFPEAATLYHAMLEGTLPHEVRLDLERMLDHFGQYPILVRSSSLLEDGFGNAFAGKYDSVFCVNQGPPEQRLQDLERAICTVFASTMSEDALAYRQQRGLADLEEPMALLMQRVNGRYHGRYYLPDAAGVGVSRNIFAWDPGLDPAAGMLRLVMGLGTRAVDRIEGDHAAVIALDQPDKRPFKDSAESGRYSQHEVDVLDIAENQLTSIALRQLSTVAPELPLPWCAELDREASERSRARGGGPIWRLSFRPLLKQTDFVAVARQMLATLEQAYGYPVDIEFTLHLEEDGRALFNLVQCRPLQTLGLGTRVDLPTDPAPERLFFATQGNFMGGSIHQPIAQVIYIDGRAYNQLTMQQKFAVARRVGQLNRQIQEREHQPTLLIGPGRWGSSTPELGVPVRFADISRIAILAEVADLGANIVPDLSFGSHFFQDLVESGIAYVAIFPQQRETLFRPQWLESLPANCRIVPPSTTEQALEAAVDEAVQVFDVRDRNLQVLADIRSQQLLCLAGAD